MLLVSIAASAQEFEFTYTYEGQTLNYSILSNETKTCQVTGNKELEGALVIPEKVQYGQSEYSVTSIASCAFSDCSGLTSVDIPNSITSIGKYAFSGCDDMIEVNIHDIVTWCNINYGGIESNPMCYTKTLKHAKVLKLNGEEITNIVIPNSVTSIKDYTFDGCSGLTSVKIHNSVTSIGTCAFSDCSGLTSISIPNSVTVIGRNAFYCCSALTSVNLPSSIISIEYATFYGCSSLKSIDIPSSVTSIEEGHSVVALA